MASGADTHTDTDTRILREQKQCQEARRVPACGQRMPGLITICESQHLEIREAIMSYMLSIQHLLIGHDSTGRANFLVPLNVNSVQQYIDNTGMSRNGTWSTDIEMLIVSHMFTFNVYSYDAHSNTWAVFSPVNIERRLPRVYNIMSVYLYLCNSHFYVVASIRRA